MLKVSHICTSRKSEILSQIEQETWSVTEAFLTHATKDPAMTSIATYNLMLFTIIFLAMLIWNFY